MSQPRGTLAQPLAVVLLVALLGLPLAEARTRKGDSLIARAKREEAKDTTADLDAALKLAEEALATDRNDTAYQLEVAKLRAFAAQYHVYDGQVLRNQVKLKEALVEFEKAMKLDPASVVAPQEAARTRELIQRLAADPNVKIEELLARPLPMKNKLDEELFATAAPVPRLNVTLKEPLPVIRVNQQPSNEVFQTLARLAGLRLLFDPDYQSRPLGLNQVLDLRGLGLDQALDHLALVTKSFWKPLSGDTIFVSNDDPARRSAYEEQVTKAFYLTNAPVQTEMSNIAGTVQKLTDIKKLFVHAEQGVIVARADPDRMALAEKVIADLDKPKAEIIIDVIIMSVTKSWVRDLGLALGLTGFNSNAVFAPRAPLSPAQVGGRIGIPLNTINRLEAGDYNVTLPGAAVEALLETRSAKLLDKAQLRTVEGQKSSLRIGQKVPYATGSFSPGVAGGVSAIVNTQFAYFDVGLNLDIFARVHEPDEVSLHIESDTSAVADRVDLGGVLQPVISQRKRVADVRVKEGEVNIWDIVSERADSRSTSGLPGLSQIPVLGRLFTNERLERSEFQILTLLVPHIIRAPDIRTVNLLGIPSGSDQVVRLRYQSPEGPVTKPPTEPRVIEVTPGAMAMGAQAASPTPPSAAPPGTAVPGPAAPGATPPTSAVPSATPPSPATQGPSTPATASPGPRLSFNPSKTTAKLNATASFGLVITDAADLAGVTATVQFDPKALRLTSAMPSGVLTGGTVSVPPGQGPENGIIVLTFGPPAVGGALGTSILTTLSFQPIAAGPTSVTITSAQVTDARKQQQAVRAEPLEILVEAAQP